jgi:hypothetical protein
MGGGGGILSPITNALFGSPAQAATPDYRGAAQETSQGNIEAARIATAANRVNQVTPYGTLTYAVTGSDPYGNPTWTATQALSPDQQELYKYDIATQKGLGQLQQKGLGYVSGMLDQPFNTSSLVKTGFDPSQSYQDAYMKRLAPQINQSREQLDQQLANQGIKIGSEAYNRAKQVQAQKENDILLGATTQGFDVGQKARQQGFQELAYQRNEPINTLNAVRSGSQVTGPSFVNSYNQATTAGPDYMGAAGLTGQANIANANAENARTNAMMSGLFSLGGAGVAKYSDIRTKENIVKIGIAENGLPVYIYEYKPEFKDQPLAGHGLQVGHMAHEVEEAYPQAVMTLENGYKAVDYGML